MPPRPWTDADTARLREDHAAGKTLHAIAKTLGRHTSTVSRRAAALGLVWDRSKTAAATEAKVLDARARRANAVETELELLERSQAQILDGLKGNGWRTFQRAEGGAEDEVNLQFVPARDVREHTAARNGMAGIIARLDDGNTAETDQQKSLVSDLMTGLRAAYIAGQQTEDAQ